jgi:hydroxymethylpyrimidine/phosphomethylpyrimidine kinase
VAITKVPCVLTIAGSDSGGGAGIQADLKTFAALGTHGLCVITAVTAQNTQRVNATFELPTDFVKKQFESVMHDFDVRWAKTGMLNSSAMIRTVTEKIRRYKLRAVVDPVMVATTGGVLMQADALDHLKGLLKIAELVTPNLYEAEKLSGKKIKSPKDMKQAARKIAEYGPKAVLIKGSHLKGKNSVDLLYSNGKFTEFKEPRIPGILTHGTGCTFSAAITAELAKGQELQEAVARAKRFTFHAIKSRLEVGHGASPVYQMAEISRKIEEGKALREVWKGAQLLVRESSFARLLPEVGTNLVMALPGAVDPSEVIGLSGRIIKADERAQVTGFPVLGGSEHVANCVLTAMRHDPEIRAGVNIRFSEKILTTCKKRGFSIQSFDRRKEPMGVKTMKWGTDWAIRKAGKVPQVIFDKGEVGKEPMIRILGRSVDEIVKVVLKIAKKLS